MAKSDPMSQNSDSFALDFPKPQRSTNIFRPKLACGLKLEIFISGIITFLLFSQVVMARDNHRESHDRDESHLYHRNRDDTPPRDDGRQIVRQDRQTRRLLGVMRGVWISRINVTSIPTTPIAARLMTGAAWETLCSKRPIQIGIGARFANRMQATMQHILVQAKMVRLITTQDLLAQISQIFPTA